MKLRGMRKGSGKGAKIYGGIKGGTKEPKVSGGVKGGAGVKYAGAVK